MMNPKTLSVDRLLFLIGSYVFYINMIKISKIGQVEGSAPVRAPDFVMN